MPTRNAVPAIVEVREDGRVEVRAPRVGLWRDAPPTGALLRPGMTAGAIEVLGVLCDVMIPNGAAGIVVEVSDPRRARTPVGHGELLVLLDPEGATGVVATEATRTEQSAGAMIFAAPMGGRFYARPSPDKPVFLEVGDELAPGRTICLLEVMKTFNRVTFGGGGHPERARVVRIVPNDGDDLAAGDPILELAPI